MPLCVTTAPSRATRSTSTGSCSSTSRGAGAIAPMHGEGKERGEVRAQQAGRTIVVKVGSSTLTDDRGKLRLARIASLVVEIGELQRQGNRMLLVTSGAVSSGMGLLSLPSRPTEVVDLQAASAVGQGPPLPHLQPALRSRARRHRPGAAHRVRCQRPRTVPQRTQHPQPAVGVGRRAHHQRERHDLDRRAGHRRQRQPCRPSRAAGQGRPAGSADRHRRAVHGQSGDRRSGRADPRSARFRRSRPGRDRFAGRAGERRHAGQGRGGPHGHGRRRRDDDRPGVPSRGHRRLRSGRRRGHEVLRPRPGPWRIQALVVARAAGEGPGDGRPGGRQGAPRARGASCPSASRASRATSMPATWCSYSTPRVGSWPRAWSATPEKSWNSSRDCGAARWPRGWPMRHPRPFIATTLCW